MLLPVVCKVMHVDFISNIVEFVLIFPVFISAIM